MIIYHVTITYLSFSPFRLDISKTCKMTSSTVLVVRRDFTVSSSMTTVNKSFMFCRNLSVNNTLESDVTGSCPHLLITASRMSCIGASGQPNSYQRHN